MSDVVGLVSDRLGLDSATRDVRIPSGATMIANRTGWARTALVRAGLIEQPRESTIAITDATLFSTTVADADGLLALQSDLEQVLQGLEKKLCV